MKWITRLHLAAHTIDLALTFLALRWELAIELNPLGFTPAMVGLKFLGVMFVAAVLEEMRTVRLAWLVVIIPVLAVAWNGLNIVLG